MGSKILWTNNDIELLTEMYVRGDKPSEIAKVINRTEAAVSSKANKLGLTTQIIKPNNPKFKAIYQDYDWCYDRFINRDMSMQEMAKEAGCSLRVMQKWCSEKHRLNDFTYKENKKLTDIQKQLIMFSLLGDGHIDKRENQPMYIESHAEDQKDYIFWKYSIVKNICLNEPKYYAGRIKYFKNSVNVCQPWYRLNTRIINDLIPIRAMTNSELIKSLNEFGLSIHLLDDGYRNQSNWEICMASYTDVEKQLYIDICKEKFGLEPYIVACDRRYLKFRAPDSRKIDQIILQNIPNELDIVKHKITENKISKPAGIINE